MQRLALLVAFVAAGCAEPEQPASVTVTPATVTLDAVGATQQLKAAVSNQAGKPITSATVTWTSSRPEVATVDAAGLVTAVGPGSAEVTASAGSASGTASVTVAPVPATVEAASGGQQTGTVGQPLPQPLVVRVRDRLGHGIGGLSVSFTVQENGGTVSPASGTTGADGQFSATWMLGTKTGTYQASAAIGNTGLTAVFVAKANPGPAHNLAKVSGDNQFGYQSSRLAQPLAVRVRDQFGNGVPSYLVQFSVQPNHGELDSSVVFSDTAGIARTTWKMPAVSGVDTVHLQASALGPSGNPLLGTPVVFTAVAHNISVQLVSPSTLVEGQPAVLTGTGFDPTNTRNAVTIDGRSATITQASATQLTVTVPAFDCLPARTVAVQLTVGGIPAAPVTRSLMPAQGALALSVGQQVILSDPASFCFQLPQSASAEAYLIGVQSVSEVASSLTPITLVGAAAAAGGALPLRLAPAAAQQPALPAWWRERLARWRDYRARELQQRGFDREVFSRFAGRLGPAPGAARAPAVGPNVQKGDTIAIRVAQQNSCTDYSEIRTVVQEIGTRGIFLDDLQNPAHYGPSDWSQFSQLYDSKIYPTNVAEFGAPPDLDGNGRIVVVVTRQVNQRGSLGFTTSCDNFPRDSTANPASNYGEIFYVAAPGANFPSGSTYALQTARQEFPDVIAHEMVHVIQFGRRLAAGGPFPDIWVAEGQAVLGEEVVGHAVEGRSAGQNLGLGPAINLDDTTSVDWYSGAFVGLGLYFGWDPVSDPSNVRRRVANAPWECTWLASNYGGPCVGGLDPYGTPWSLFRYLNDRFGPSRAGGEAQIQQAIVDSRQNGFAMLQSVIGVPMDSLLAQWAAMLYVDDALPQVPAALSMSSWNLHDIFYGTFTTSGGQTFRLLAELRLTPVSLGFGDFTQSARVRGASTYYALVSGSAHPAIAIKARDALGGFLPATMRYWIVRVQ